MFAFLHAIKVQNWKLRKSYWYCTFLQFNALQTRCCSHWSNGCLIGWNTKWHTLIFKTKSSVGTFCCFLHAPHKEKMQSVCNKFAAEYFEKAIFLLAYNGEIFRGIMCLC